MTNKEKYKQAFSAIHISNEFTLEEKNMKASSKNPKLKRLIAGIAVCAITVGGATAAYAADVGGIQRSIQLWMHGDRTEATIQFDGSGNYSMDYTDSEGNVKHQGGGGVSFAPDGTEIPATDEELMDQLLAPEVRYEDDGRVFVHWFDQKIDITDKFENDACYVKLVSGDDILYMTVKYQNGYVTSPHKYLSPAAFNAE